MESGLLLMTVLQTEVPFIWRKPAMGRRITLPAEST